MSWGLSPYFKASASMPHTCPECGALLNLGGLEADVGRRDVEMPVVQVAPLGGAPEGRKPWPAQA